MPHKAPHPCPQAGCPNIVRAGRCPDHTPPAWRRTAASARPTTSGWAQYARRQRILERDGRICHVCRQPGADQVDHVIPLGEQGPDTDDNLAAIHARPCHAAKTAAESARARARARTQRSNT